MIMRNAFCTIFAGLLAVSPACAFAAEASTGGSCTQPATPAQNDVVAVPDYDTEASALPDPDIAAAQTAWKQYQDSVFEALSASANPHDWALAAGLGSFMPNSESTSPQRAALAVRATTAAPDDVLVQWLALGRLRSAGDSADSAPLHALQALEPDNAAVWLDSLTAAVKVKDATAVAIALERMADSKRFDLHYLAIVRLAAGAYRRYPVPDTYFAYTKVSGMPDTQDALVDTMGFVFASAYALPSFQSLVHACSIDPQTGANALHAPDCARIGHLLVAHADTLIAQRIGFAVLRVSHTFNDNDVQIARQQDWIFAQRIDADSENTPRGAIAFMRDFYTTGNEIDAMRLAVARAGKPLEPPVDWVDKRSPFSAARLREDAHRH